MTKTNLTTIPLLELEKSWALMVTPSISSITFFRGNLLEVERGIRSRFQRIISSNPWLKGRLIKNKRYKNVVLQFDGSTDLERDLEKIYHPNETSIKINTKMDYRSLMKNIEPVLVKKGQQLVNSDNPLVSFSLIPDADQPNEKFALVFSVSHIIADGFTYYELLNSFSDDSTIPIFNIERKLDKEKKFIEAIGVKRFAFSLSFGLKLNTFKGLITGKKAKCYAFYIDQHKIQQAKNKLLETSEFVSTNDIITSSFSNAVKARLCMMAINFRNRIDNLINSDAGNYSSVLFFDKENYGTPLGIRKSLQSGSPMKTTSNKMPGFFETLRSKIAIITNWSNFSKPLSIHGAANIIHYPVYNLNLIPYDFAIIFEPLPNRIAVMYLSKTLSKEEILDHCEVNEPIDLNSFD